LYFNFSESNNAGKESDNESKGAPVIYWWQQEEFHFIESIAIFLYLFLWYRKPNFE
jgi:hypothetical protein